MMSTVTMRIATEVTEALRTGRPVVALESTLLAHGLPPGRNIAVAARLEETVRAAGAVPATIAVLDGVPVIGLATAELDRVCAPDAGLVKLSDRDIGPAVAAGISGATTVASTAVLAAAAGITTFGTGGIGGVHRNAGTSWDVSADLAVLARTPIVVVCAGVKSVLDVPATLEVLETNSVPLLGYRTDTLPLFYLRSSEFGVPWRVDTPEQVATVAAAHWSVAPGRQRSGLILANPIPAEAEMDSELHERLLAGALELIETKGVRGRDVTPVMLEHFHTASEGLSLDVNQALVLHNATVAAEVAAAMTRRVRIAG